MDRVEHAAEAYEPPVLVELGTLEELTLGGPGDFADVDIVLGVTSV